jgi:hypothetical protein
MKRLISVFGVLAVLTFAVSVPALTQEGETQGAYQYDQYDQGAAETQYEQGVTEIGCYWYWGYKWSQTGEWEQWCWDPQKGGWWYATSEDGSKQYYRNTQPGVVINTTR